VDSGQPRSGTRLVMPARASTASGHTREFLRRLELDVERRLDGLLQGDYQGLVSGLGSEPGETRAYRPGDDVRRMDWNVTARLGEPHVRETIADRELETSVLVDLSPSLDFGTAMVRKVDLAMAVVAATGILTERAGNRLGAIIATADEIHDLGARSGRRHLMALLHQIAAHDPASIVARPHQPLFGEALRRLAGPGHRTGLAVVISDLLRPDWDGPLRTVTQRHDTLVVEVVDPRELTLPNVGIIELQDRQRGAITEVDTRSDRVRARYEAAGRERLADHAQRVRRAGADHLVLRTDRDWVIDLARFVDRRRRRRQPGRPRR